MEGLNVIKKIIDSQDNNKALIGRVENYNIDRRTATVQPLINVDGKPLPLLIEVPHIHMSYGNFTIYAPLYKGDIVIVLLMDRDSDNAIISGSVSNPNSERKHSLDDAVILGTIQPINDIDNSDIVDDAINIKGENNHITLHDDGNIDIEGKVINITGDRVHITERRN